MAARVSHQSQESGGVTGGRGAQECLSRLSQDVAPMRLLDLHAEVVVMVLQQVERVQDLARMDRVSHAFHSPPPCQPTLLQRPQPLVQQALRLRAEAGAFADLATESAWAHLSDGAEAARMIRQAARACALREQHTTGL